MHQRKTALVTGASAGIGYELAKLFAQDGHDLVLVARSEETLQQMAQEWKQRFGIAAKVIAKDLGEPAAPEEVYAELRKESIHIDFLVNNAGFGAYGFFSETDLASELEMIRVNITALTHLTKLFLKDMLKLKDGKIMNVASTAAFQAGPLMAVYYATKAYVLSFSEALANELKGTGVTVTAFCPGPTLSGFQKRANMKKSKLASGGIMMTSAAAAKIGYLGFLKGKTIVIPGLRNKLLAFSVRLGPRGLVTQIVRGMQEQRKD